MVLFKDDKHVPNDDVIPTASNHTNATEDEEIYDYLTDHNAFRRLISQVQMSIKRQYSNHMDRIGYLIRSKWQFSLDIPGTGNLNVLLSAEWDVRNFLLHDYPAGLAQDLGSIVVIIGRAKNAHLSTVRNYLQRTWPIHSLDLLNAIQTTVSKDAESVTMSCK